jgi:hypothetical protein
MLNGWPCFADGFCHGLPPASPYSSISPLAPDTALSDFYFDFQNKNFMAPI